MFARGVFLEIKISARLPSPPSTEDRAKRLLEFLSAARPGADIDGAIEHLCKLVRDTARQNQFDVPRTWLNEAEEIAGKRRARNSISTLRKWKAYLEEREKSYAAWQRSRKILDATPADREANGTVGKWLAVFDANWKKALPRLAMGPAGEWQRAAATEYDAANNNDFSVKLDVARQWSEIADHAEGHASYACRLHSREILVGINQKNLLESQKRQLEVRLATLQRSLEDAESIAFLASEPPVIVSRPPLDLADDRWINLLDTVKFPQHAVVGNWVRNPDGSVFGSAHSYGRFFVPYALNGSYKVVVEFTRHRGINEVSLHLPIGDTAIDFIARGWQNKGDFSGFQLIGGKSVDALHSPGLRLANGVKYCLEVDVAQNGTKIDLLATIADNKFEWSGYVEQLSHWGGTAMPSLRVPGIGLFNGDVSIHKMDVMLMLNGRGGRLNDEAWVDPFGSVASRPPRDLERDCIRFHNKMYYFSREPVSLPEAQRRALMYQGRLLTISSEEEELFIREHGERHRFWTAGWRHEASDVWRDERNAPWRYPLHWATNQPDNLNNDERFLSIFTDEDPSGWNDVGSGVVLHACLEWGEE